MPKPRVPHVFTGQGRADWDEWAWDCERFFRRNPIVFVLESAKCEFADEWLGRPQKLEWSRITAATAPNAITWEFMKDRMLNTMGTPRERNYDTHDGELLALVESFKTWRRTGDGGCNGPRWSS